MSNYAMADARFTSIYTRRIQNGEEILERVPYELVRFDVDINPSGQQYIVPLGNSDHVPEVSGTKLDAIKRYEKVWIVDGAPPFREKTYMS